MRESSPYREVRALERGLLLMEALGSLGWSTPAELAEKSRIDRSTVYRLLGTLMQMDYVARRTEDSRYFLTPKVQWVGSHVRRDDIDVQAVMPHLGKLVQEIYWPSDFATVVAGNLTIQASNHSQTTMSIYRCLIGLHRPLVRSALGRAIIAALRSDELEHTLDTVRATSTTDVAEVADRNKIQRVIEDTQERGYASQSGLVHPKFGAIALPVRQSNRVVGAINMIYFRSAMSLEEAVERYLDPLKSTVLAVEQSLEERGGAY